MRYKDYKEIKGNIPIKKPDNVSEEQWNKAVNLYTVAKQRGDRYPELTVSQAILETGWFKSPSGRFNFFGQKASKNQEGTVKTTQEVANDNFYTTQAKFRDYDSLQSAVDDRIEKWGTKYKDAPTINDAIYRIWQYDEQTGQGKGYATDNMYDRKLKSILKAIGVDLNYKGNVKSDKVDLANPNVQREDTVVESTYVDPKVSEKMINFVNRSQNSTFATPQLPNVEEKTDNKETEKAKEVIEEKKNEEKFIQDILSNKIQPIATQQQPTQQTVQPFGSYILNKAKELGIFQEGGELDEERNLLDGVGAMLKSYGSSFIGGVENLLGVEQDREVLENRAETLRKGVNYFADTPLNYRNIGVPNYTDSTSNFNSAFEQAKKSGEPEFMFNGKRYSTEVSDMSKQQELETYGIISEQATHNNFLRDSWAKNLVPDPRAISTTGMTTLSSTLTGIIGLVGGEGSKEQGYENHGFYLSDEEFENKLQKDINSEDFNNFITTNPAYKNAGSIEERKETYKNYQTLFRKYGQQIEDIYQLYLGKPQKFKTVGISDYKPSIGAEKDQTYYSAKRISNDEELVNNIINNIKEDKVINEEEDKLELGSLIAKGKNSYVGMLPSLGRTTVSLGKDDKGEYLSYYDEWDVTITGGTGAGKQDSTMGIGKPIKLYDRIYYKQDKDGKYKIVK